MESLAGNAFPCVEADPSGSQTFGRVLLKSPRYRSEFLILPADPVQGVESSVLQQEAANPLWVFAWQSRHNVEGVLHGSLPAEAIGLTVNSSGSRTQDQFHIHVDCVSNAVQRQLLNIPIRKGAWTPITNLAGDGAYIATQLGAGDLATTNIMAIVASQLPTGTSLGEASVAVVGVGKGDNASAFNVLVRFDNRAAEDLLDHTCASVPVH
jgi:CDP-diacylglycerol pyrophosphatase